MQYIVCSGNVGCDSNKLGTLTDASTLSARVKPGPRSLQFQPACPQHRHLTISTCPVSTVIVSFVYVHIANFQKSKTSVLTPGLQDLQLCTSPSWLSPSPFWSLKLPWFPWVTIFSPWRLVCVCFLQVLPGGNLPLSFLEYQCWLSHYQPILLYH